MRGHVGDNGRPRITVRAVSLGWVSKCLRSSNPIENAECPRHDADRHEKFSTIEGTSSVQSGGPDEDAPFERD
jgi:hypothetical protein